MELRREAIEHPSRDLVYASVPDQGLDVRAEHPFIFEDRAGGRIEWMILRQSAGDFFRLPTDDDPTDDPEDTNQ
ncbi:MAG: hypothetical protein AAGF11_22565 [Myxococcota bacterium]